MKRKMGEKIYLYYATAIYRNEKGQRTSDRVSIGRYDEESGMLIPNRNYYEVYLKQSTPVMTGVNSSGMYMALRGISDNLGLIRILKVYFLRTGS